MQFMHDVNFYQDIADGFTYKNPICANYIIKSQIDDDNWFELSFKPFSKTPRVYHVNKEKGRLRLNGDLEELHKSIEYNEVRESCPSDKRGKLRKSLDNAIKAYSFSNCNIHTWKTWWTNTKLVH